MILGFDPGYERCGFAVLDLSGKLITSGVIKTSAKTPFPERLLEIQKDIQHLVEQFKPTVIGIEDLFFVQNTTTGLKVAGVRGIILCEAAKIKAEILEPKPVEVKSSFTGNGKADKKAMLVMAKQQFNLPDKIIDDAVDAIAVAFYAYLMKDKT